MGAPIEWQRLDWQEWIAEARPAAEMHAKAGLDWLGTQGIEVERYEMAGSERQSFESVCSGGASKGSERQDRNGLHRPGKAETGVAGRACNGKHRTGSKRIGRLGMLNWRGSSGREQIGREGRAAEWTGRNGLLENTSTRF